MSISTPVVLLIFNRPKLTQIVFDAIRKAQPKQLLVVADGARSPEELDKCNQARSVIQQVDWDCEVLTNFSEVNLGCKERITSGLNWAFSIVEEAIILEDDCLPADSFFHFCEELLIRYRYDNRIFVVSGNNFQNGISRTNYSYYFSKYNHCWGWATWRRAWQHWDSRSSTWLEFRNANMMSSICEEQLEQDYWRDVFDRVFLEGNPNIWDLNWVFNCWSQNGLTILPNQNLVSNIGLGEDATHTKASNSLSDLPVVDIWEIKHPPFVVCNKESDRYTFEKVFGGKSSIDKTDELSLSNKYDYIADGLETVYPDGAFPNMVSGNTNNCGWQYLRREIPHHWYVDRRSPSVGFLSRDEAHILYNSALQFKGKRALEIGCWMGWSACHLALAGVELDVIDPLLGQPDFFDSIKASLTAAGVIDSVNLMAGSSPEKVEEIALTSNRKWSLIFIDGNHESPFPFNDAVTCEKFAEEDSMIFFHDLASPEVSQGLDYLRGQGWQTMVYQTMQIMGVAWRGNVQPIHHIPDPKVKWMLPVHLQYYDVSGVDNPDLQEFRELAIQIFDFTLLSEMRLFALYAATKQICLEDLPGDFVECGAYKGGASAMMAAVIKRYSKRRRKLFAFDTFAGMPEPTERDRHAGILADDTGYGKGTLSAPMAENINRIVEQLGVQDIVQPVAGLFSDTLSTYRSQISEIALLHADGDWYESTMDIFNNLYDLVIPNGVIQVDDYGHWEGCRIAIHDFERVRSLKFNLEIIDYTGVRFNKPSPTYFEAAYWHTAIPRQFLSSFQNALHEYSYKGIVLQKNPFDFALYPLLIWEIKPKTIIEIGSRAGGSALWLGDLLDNYGIEGHIYSIDINCVNGVSHQRVTFWEGDQNNLELVLTPEFIESLPRPLLVIEDGAHFYESTINTLEFFHPYLRKDEYIIIEDGIVTDLGEDPFYRGGPCLALREFFFRHTSEYVIDRKYCDFFGQNVTWNINGYLRKIKDVAIELSNESLEERFQLRSQNFIVFFDWSSSFDSLYSNLQSTLKAVLRSPVAESISLLIYANSEYAQKADSLMSEVVMELLMQSDLELEQEPLFSIVSDIDVQEWRDLHKIGLKVLAVEGCNQKLINNLPVKLLTGSLEEIT